MHNKKIIEHNIVMADPLPSKEDLKIYYEKQYYQTADGNKTTYDIIYTNEELEHKVLESKIAIQAIKNYFKSESEKISLIEFGCGEGFFLNQATICGWQVRGTDFSKFGIEKWHPHLMANFSIGDSYDYIEHCKKNNESFDVCVLRNVLEHVINPKLLLEDLKKMLKPNGILLITVPNDYSRVQNLAMELGHIDKEFWFSPPDHLYYFNTNNISSFIGNQGFEIVDMYSSFPIDFFLFHPGSNYVKNKANGKAAHFARVQLDLLISQSGLDKTYELYRALAQCGIGRDFTVLLKSGL